MTANDETVISSPTGPRRAHARWYRRWEVLLAIALAAVPLVGVGAWFALGLACLWEYDRYYEKMRAQGYALTKDDFRAQQRNLWQAARDASPVRTATVRLSLYGARVAGLTITTGIVTDFAELSYAYSRMLPDFDPQQPLQKTAEDVAEQKLGTGKYILPQQDPATASSLVNNPDWKQWPRHLQGANGRFLASSWRVLLEMDCPWPASVKKPIDSENTYPDEAYQALQRVFYVHRCAFVLLGEAEEAVQSWEHCHLLPPIRNAGMEDADVTRMDMNLLCFSIRSGLFREQHLLRLLAVSAHSADQRRDTWSLLRRQMLSRYVSYPQFRLFGNPDTSGLWTYLTAKARAYHPSDHPIMALFPRQIRLLWKKLNCEIDAKYEQDLQALRGTLQWPAPPESGNNLLLGNRAAMKIEWREHYRSAAESNLRVAAIAFALYRERTGKIPAALAEFMDAEPSAAGKLIAVPYLKLDYSVAPTGVAAVELRADLTGLPGGSDPMQISSWATKAIVYDPTDVPPKFPIGKAPEQ